MKRSEYFYRVDYGDFVPISQDVSVTDLPTCNNKLFDDFYDKLFVIFKDYQALQKENKELKAKLEGCKCRK